MLHGDIAGIRARARRSWYADGLYDLLIGGLLIVQAGVWLVPRSSRWLAWLLLLVVMGGMFRSRDLLLRLKERIIFPHAGYAVPRRPAWWSRLLAAVVLVPVALALTRLEGLLRAAGWIDPDATTMMVMIALCALGSGVWYSIRGWVLVGLLGLVLSFGLPLIGLRTPVVFAVFESALGVVLLAYGAFTLRGFLRRFPVGPTGAEGDEWPTDT